MFQVRRCSVPVLLFSFTMFAVALSARAQPTRTNDSWLDRPLVNWNRRYGNLPRLPTPSAAPGDSANTNRCRRQVRTAASAAERALARRGWMLYGPVQRYGMTRVVTALSGFDGMCRPVGFHAFVYWEGRYAGTLSPDAMDSRADGSLTNVRLDSATRISADFVRYDASDPLCCPSRTSRVTYEVSRDEAPLVTPVEVNTGPVGAPVEGDVTGNDGSDAAQLFGRRWRLTEVRGAAVRESKAFIEFDRAAQRFSGHGGCNGISGGFEVNGTNLSFSRVISTRRACLDREVQQVETNFLNGLGQTTRFRIRDDTLRLSAGRAPILVFRADAGGTPEEARVTGTVTYLQRIALPPGAVVEVKLLDVSRGGAPAVTIAEQLIRTAGRQVPFAFDLRYDPRRVGARGRYVIRARILEGARLLFTNTEAYPVITGGHPNVVEVIVKPVRR